jgi:hypothetical protein
LIVVFEHGDRISTRGLEEEGLDREGTKTGCARAQCENIEPDVTRLDRVT